MNVSLAQMPDFPEILKLYSRSREFMAKNGNPTQWGSHYPPVELLEEDIASGRLYVVRDPLGIHGVFAFLIGTDPTYLRIDGAWHAQKTYGTIHRVASDGTGGVFSEILRFCRKQIPYLRIDTHEKNLVMRHVLEKNGFQYCGTILTDDGTPRHAYDRLDNDSCASGFFECE